VRSRCSIPQSGELAPSGEIGQVWSGDRQRVYRALRKLDELGPGDVVTIKANDGEVTITARPRRHRGIHISRVLRGPHRSDILRTWPTG